MVDQMFERVAMPVVNLRIQLFNVVADVVVHVAQRLRYWDVHLLYPPHRVFQRFQVCRVVF
jgi:hypothetical protein